MSQPSEMPVFVAIGSNIGDAEGHVARAFSALKMRFPGTHRCSSLYRTAPVDCPGGSPPFVNAVMVIERFDQKLDPTELLAGLLMLERAFGRLQRHERNEPRVLDLDVVAAGSLTGTFGALEVPHARAHGRAFVLLPMAELAPDFVLPGQSKTVSELLLALDTAGCEKITGA